jgi:hypothetical protein
MFCKQQVQKGIICTMQSQIFYLLIVVANNRCLVLEKKSLHTLINVGLGKHPQCRSPESLIISFIKNVCK